MDYQKFEELQSRIRHLSQENARLYEAYFEEWKKVNDFSGLNEEKQKRIYELEKILSNYENKQRILIDGREKLLKKIEITGVRLSDREKESNHQEALAKAREIESNAELQEARKKLMDVLLTLSSNIAETADIGVKNLGQVDFTAFHGEMRRGSGRSMDMVMAFDMASDLCGKWENKIKNPLWHPFKVVNVEGKPVEIIDEDDEDLKGLLDDMGKEVYKAVTMALTEMNEHNPKGDRNVVQELWNFRKDRKATLKEGIAFLAEQYSGKYVQDSSGYSSETEIEEKGFSEMDM